MPENSQPIPSPNVQPARWRHRIACTANLFFDVDTDSPDTEFEKLERLAIAALKRGSAGPSDLPLHDVAIDLPMLLNGRLYPEPNYDDGLDNFSIEDCSPINTEG
jgi:hypothetical protein